MKYLIETNSQFLLKQIVSKINQHNKINLDNFIVLDFEEIDGLNEGIRQYLSLNIFAETKSILIKNCSFFNDARLSRNFKLMMTDLLKVDSPNLIFFHINKLTKKNPLLIKFDKTYKHIVKFKPIGKELTNYILNYFAERDLIISPFLARKILIRTNSNFDIVNNELNKLMLLKKPVTESLIDQVVFDQKGETIFALIEAIFRGNILRLDQVMNKLRVQGYGAIQILELIISDLSLMLLIKKHDQNMSSKIGNTRIELSQAIKINPFRIVKATENSRHWNTTKLMTFLEEMIILETKLMMFNSLNQEEILKLNLILNLSNLLI